MLEVTDDRGQLLRLGRPPRRIVSLVPSTTETLFALGLGDRVVGITRFCVHPARELADRVRVGGTKDLDLDRLEAVQPDLVIGNAEENSREIFAAVEARWPLYVAFPRTVDQATEDLRRMGALLGAEAAARSWLERVAAARAELRALDLPRRTAVYLVWRKPWMAAGPDTFIAALLAEAGLELLPAGPGRYPEVQVDALAADLVLLSSEPFPFRQRHASELARVSGLPRDRLRLVDGELCSWHGVRMALAFPYLARQLAPGQDRPELP